MKKTLLSILFCSLIPFPSNTLLGQRDIKAILLRDIVKVENGTFSIREFGILSTFDKDFAVKVTATAPKALLSRDNFLRFYGALSSSIFSTFLSQEGIKAPDDLHILLKDKPGDPIDITVNITMSEKGIDYTVATKNSKSKMKNQGRCLFASTYDLRLLKNYFSIVRMTIPGDFSEVSTYNLKLSTFDLYSVNAWLIIM